MLGKKLIQAAAVKGGGAELGIEDVFSTWLYTGNNSTQTITNGIDLAGEGGLVWIKSRSGGGAHNLFDTNRGNTKALYSYLTGGQATTSSTEGLTGFNADGFTLGTNFNETNENGTTTCSWTFRKAEKFFDVVTYTGDGVAGRTVAHNLGSVPGCIIVKRTDLGGDNWNVYHRSLGGTKFLALNTTGPVLTASTSWNNTDPTSTVFSLGNSAAVNASGGTYVAYLFAHDAGGFGNNGTESVIKCGSYTGNGSTTGPVIDLGWEPQWVILKQSSSTGQDWEMYDNMRGVATGGNDMRLQPNTGAAESTTFNFLSFNSTGFQPESTADGINANGSTYIYIAIRRGPMKTPEDATKVFDVDAQTGGAFVTTNYPVDTVFFRQRGVSDTSVVSRLTGPKQTLAANLMDPEATYAGAGILFDNNNGFEDDYYGGGTPVYWSFRRAPGFFDVVTYTGNGSTNTVSHNLGVAPELIIAKRRDGNVNWVVYHSSLGANRYIYLNLTATAQNGTFHWGVAPTSTEFTVGLSAETNASSGTYIAYLFATCPGVSKVGSYTGTGTTLNVDCGFASGARFVLIKRTDSTGDWYVWDSARGIVSGNDPYLLLNSTDAENTSTDYIDPLSSGFQISSSAPAAINANGGSYIFLAIA